MNTKTGDVSYDHPLDDVYRQKVIDERKKLSKPVFDSSKPAKKIKNDFDDVQVKQKPTSFDDIGFKSSKLPGIDDFQFSDDEIDSKP